MSTFRNPVGPQPSTVYWRRRLVVLLGLVAVIVVVALIVFRPPANPDPASTTKPGTATSPAPTASADATEGAACDLTKVTLEASTDASGYDPGVNPVLSFSLKSLMTTPCTISAGSDLQEFIITSGDEVIWDSKDCQEAPVAATVILQPGVPLAGPTLTWDRTRSSADTCGTARDQVIAGGASYHLEVRIGELTSESTRQFLLY